MTDLPTPDTSPAPPLPPSTQSLGAAMQVDFEKLRAKRNAAVTKAIQEMGGRLGGSTDEAPHELERIAMNARDPLTTEEAAARWRRAVRACLPGETPETAVECCSHLALRDAEAQIAQLLASLRALVERHTEI